MLPYLPLASEPSAHNDPDAQWRLLLPFIKKQDHEVLEDSYLLASRAHADQRRRSVEGASPVPFIVHPIRVALILAREWSISDRDTLAAALLHDVIEDSPPSVQTAMANEVEEAAGRTVCDAVWTLSKPYLPRDVPAETKARRDADYFRGVRTAAEWVRLIKCADRVDNLRDALRWGDRQFWARYTSETVGWHLLLARETAPIAEVALFKVIVEGERAINGRVPVWADGHLIDPAAARRAPENVARQYRIVGLARRGSTLVIGSDQTLEPNTLEAIRLRLNETGNEEIRSLEAMPISQQALRDAFAAGLYGAAVD